MHRRIDNPSCCSAVFGGRVLRGAGRHRDTECDPLARLHRSQSVWLNTMSIALRHIEGEAGEPLDRSLRLLFAGDISPGQKLTVETVYDLVEAMVARKLF